jgi:hypothetical protein
MLILGDREHLKIFALKFLPFVFLVSFSSLRCGNTATQKKQVFTDSSIRDTSSNSYVGLAEKEKLSSEINYDTLGKLISEIPFQVKTSNLADYKDGLVPYITIEHPEDEIKNLIDRNKIVIATNVVTIIIDYPLSNIYKFDIVSEVGFSRETLIREISKHYHMIYDEEEQTATIKTIPVKKRTKMYNRNQTNGKYGIWGHDMGDLVLANILVYATANGKVVLSLEIES